LIDSANGKPERLWSARDLLIAVPIVGTILAVTYDVGFFLGLDISLFTLFSLPEHIVFALQAIPIVFFLAVLVAAAIAGRLHGERTGAAVVARILGAASEESVEARLDTEMRRIRRNVFWTAVGLGLLGIVMALGGAYFYASIFGLCILMGLGDHFLPEQYHPSKRLPWSMSFCVFVMSFTLGLQNARDVWAQRSPTESILLAGQSNGTSGRLIRSGDRGLLFFDPAKKAISFILWNDVKGIQTLR
jgi:hypothetical protein